MAPGQLLHYSLSEDETIIEKREAKFKREHIALSVLQGLLISRKISLSMLEDEDVDKFIDATIAITDKLIKKL